METTFTVNHISQAGTNSIHLWGFDELGTYWRTTFNTYLMQESAFALWAVNELSRGRSVVLVCDYNQSGDEFYAKVRGTFWEFKISKFFDWR